MPAECTPSNSECIAQAARWLAEADHLLILTGAGLSAESGIPTFRDAQTGFWARFSPQDLATPEAFADNPERVWNWYHWRRTLIARGGVNAGHRAIAELARRSPTTLVTQNVDGLHAAAGSNPVHELHGNIWRERCPGCGCVDLRPIAESTDEEPPCCTACGHMARPDVVWFGETLPGPALEAAQQALERADCVLVVGTSNRVYPAAAIVDAAVRSSARVIELNPAATPVSSQVDCRITAAAGTALPALLR